MTRSSEPPQLTELALLPKFVFSIVPRGASSIDYNSHVLDPVLV